MRGALALAWDGYVSGYCPAAEGEKFAYSQSKQLVQTPANI